MVHEPSLMDHSVQEGPLIVCKSVQDMEWLHVLNYREANVVSVSAPCQSWSTLGIQEGLSSQNGKALLIAVKTLRLTQPALVLFEQVAGFRQHHEFEAFVQAMNEAGFRIAVAGVHDLALLSHCTRRRWLAVFINSVHVTKWDLLEKWLHPIVRGSVPFNPKEHCIAVFTDEQRHAVEISREDYDILNDVSLLPRWNRNSPMAKHHPFSVRIYGEGDTLPTVTASYRTATSFARSYLTGNGLMSWVIRDAQGMTRWMSKHEACRALGFGPYTSLPSDEAAAFKGIGNSISPLHASLVISYASDVAALQTGAQPSLRFNGYLESIRATYKPMDAYVVRKCGIRTRCW